MSTLDLSGLEQFKSSALLKEASGKPLEIALELIEFDPKQPRRQLCENQLHELARTITLHGVTQPVALRPHPDLPGRYIVYQGERRVRACQLAGKATVPAFVVTTYDPFVQAVENLQREDLSPLDLAAFIDERLQDGYSLTDIARKLGKSKSFISETVKLIDAPQSLLAAYAAGRVRDTRTLNQLTRLHEDDPTAYERILAQEGTIQRQPGRRATKYDQRAADFEAVDRPVSPTGMDITMAWQVEWNGKTGLLMQQNPPSAESAIIVMDNDRRIAVKLRELKLVSWVFP